MPNRPYLALPLLAAALFGSTVGAFAQTAAPPAAAGPSNAGAGSYGPAAPGPGALPPRRRPRSRVARALGGLALSPAQRAKIHGFMHAYRAARRAGNPQPRAQLIAQIESVLTPPERSKFERRLHRTHRPSGPGPGQQPQQERPPQQQPPPPPQ